MLPCGFYSPRALACSYSERPDAPALGRLPCVFPGTRTADKWRGSRIAAIPALRRVTGDPRSLVGHADRSLRSYVEPLIHRLARGRRARAHRAHPLPYLGPTWGKGRATDRFGAGPAVGRQASPRLPASSLLPAPRLWRTAWATAAARSTPISRRATSPPC